MSPAKAIKAPLLAAGKGYGRGLAEPDGVRRRSQAAPAPPSRTGRVGSRAPGHARNQEPGHGCRRSLQALAAEGHRSRAGGNYSGASLDGRRRRIRAVARDFGFKVNRKERRAALAGALSEHARRGSIAVIDGAALTEPSTKKALELLADWQHELPLLIVAQPDEEALAKSFRNLPRTLVIPASELEVVALVWARSLLVSEASLPLVQTKAEMAPRREESK